MRKFYPLIFILFIPFYTHAQQLAKYNLYQYSMNYINPAATGCNSCKSFRITDKHQWVGIEGAPSIQTISISMPKQFHKLKKHGLGLNVVRDRNGAVQNLGGEFIYSFHIAFGRSNVHFLSFGLSGKFGQYTMDERGFDQEIYDPIVTNGLELEFYGNASTGAYIYNESYFGGIGIHNLVPYSSNIYQEYGNENYFVTLIGGKNLYSANKQNMFKTSVYAAIGNGFYQLDFNNFAYINSTFWAGLTMRKYFGDFGFSGQNAIFYFGYEIERFDLSYAFDLGINRLQFNHYGSHQISIAYKICKGKYACPTYK